MFRLCPALASSGPDVNCRGISVELNLWYVTRQLLQVLVSPASKSVFPYFSKTNSAKNDSMRPACWIGRYNSSFSPFSFSSLLLICWFRLQAAECFMADFAFLNVIFLINLNNAAPFPGSVPVAFFVAKTHGWHSHVDNRFNEVRKLWISLEAENSSFIFARITSIQMN